MSFVTPEFFLEKINANPEVSATIHNALEKLFPWFQDNKLFFFPEFTDHGVEHINTVLSTAESLISPEAKLIFSSEDAGATIAAILLHDCAMHISWEGFQTLLSGEYIASSPLLPAELPAWPDLFNSFMHQAFRWDQGKLLEVIGAIRPIRRPPENLVDVTEVDRRVIGEFIRIHHARIAHEIAHLGVPGPIENRSNWLRPLIGTVLPPDLIGLIARSHNLSIRKAKDLLPKRRRTEFSGIHAPYVMSLLRIADYLQIQSKRAHPSLLSIRRVSSTISVQEWNKHAATIDIHSHGDDPEALIVHTEPTNVSTLFSLRSLFHSMQQELDETWACLGEVYGRHPAFAAFAFNGLRTRRIQTNIDDLKTFNTEERPEYIPTELRLRSAGAEMFGLLVNPLYDGVPSIAVRELVQNAVDACNERQAYEVSSGKTTSQPTVTVELNIESDTSGFLQVTDTGIGMTLETIREYFLVAGASFRKSGWWKDHFTGDDGKSAINRSGRFGVGALASFLVGQTTTVTTRHISDTTGQGIEFSYGIENSLVEAKHVPAEIGTKIRININSFEILKELQEPSGGDYFDEAIPKLHWYGLNNPKIKCYITRNADKVNIERTFSIPQLNEALKPDWNVFNHPDFRSIHWSFEKIKVSSNSYARNWLFCNGILVENSWAPKILEISPGSPTIILDDITLSVFDPDGFLPLNLARNSLKNNEIPFKNELLQSIASFFVQTLKSSWAQSSDTPTACRAIESIKGFHKARYNYQSSNIFGLFAYSNKGVCLLDSYILSKANFDRILLVHNDWIQSHLTQIENYLKIEGAALIPLNGNLENKSDIEGALRAILNPDSVNRKFFENFGQKVDSIRIHCPINFLNIAREKGRIPQYMLQEWPTENIDSDNIVLKWGNISKLSNIDLKNYSDLKLRNTMFTEVIFSQEKTPVSLTPLSTEWFLAKEATVFLNKT